MAGVGGGESFITAMDVGQDQKSCDKYKGTVGLPEQIQL